MNIVERKELLVQLGHFMLSNDEYWLFIKSKASSENKWFTPEFIELAIKNIVENFLQSHQLQQLIDENNIPDINPNPKEIGIVMAGNIPLVGFHDLLSVFLTGNHAVIKTSTKDDTLISAVVKKMISLHPDVQHEVFIKDILKGCDVFIATGSNNSSTYFEYYFRNYPHIIRKNRTSVAILTGKESQEDLENLADDVHLYFGLGCRNVTKIYVPQDYNFEPLLIVFKKYHYLANHNKYKNNYDYNLAIHILNKRYYMTNENIILVEDKSPFSPISQLHYEYYTDIQDVKKELSQNDVIQCVVGKNDMDFGAAQHPNVCDYADGVNTIQFLLNLN